MFTISSLDLWRGKKSTIYYPSCLVLCGIKNNIIWNDKRSLWLGIIYYPKTTVTTWKGEIFLELGITTSVSVIPT